MVNAVCFIVNTEHKPKLLILYLSYTSIAQDHKLVEYHFAGHICEDLVLILYGADNLAPSYVQ